MESGGEVFENNVVAKVVCVTSIARSVKKKAKKVDREALEVACVEMKWKGKQLDLRRVEV